MFSLSTSGSCVMVSGFREYSHCGAGTTISGSASNTGTKRLRIVSKTAMKISPGSPGSLESLESRFPDFPDFHHFLDYEHTVAVAIKPIPFRYSMPVGTHYKF